MLWGKYNKMRSNSSARGRSVINPTYNGLGKGDVGSDQ